MIFIVLATVFASVGNAPSPEQSSEPWGTLVEEGYVMNPDDTRWRIDVENAPEPHVVITRRLMRFDKPMSGDGESADNRTCAGLIDQLRKFPAAVEAQKKVPPYSADHPPPTDQGYSMISVDSADPFKDDHHKISARPWSEPTANWLQQMKAILAPCWKANPER